MITIWNYSNYKVYLKAVINHKDAPKGMVRRLAEAAGCLPSYISQAINSKVQITPEHAHGIAQHLNLNTLETEYWMTLVELGRAGNLKYKNFLEAKRQKLESQNQQISERIQRASKDVSTFGNFYYSHWAVGAIHVITATDDYQTVNAISVRLNLEPEFVLKTLLQLKDLGFVTQSGERWIYSQTNQVHVPHDSPYVLYHHRNWRSKAVDDAQKLSSDVVHFTGAYTIAREDFGKIKELLLEYIQKINQVAGPSKAEDLIAITCDVFWA